MTGRPFWEQSGRRVGVGLEDSLELVHALLHLRSHVGPEEHWKDKPYEATGLGHVPLAFDPTTTVIRTDGERVDEQVAVRFLGGEPQSAGSLYFGYLDLIAVFLVAGNGSIRNEAGARFHRSRWQAFDSE